MTRRIWHGGNGYAVSRNLTPKLVAISDLRPLGRATRTHPAGQIRKIAASLNRFGFVFPILIDAEHHVVAGWGLVLAARRLGLADVPAVTITDLSEAELRALRLALNRLGDESVWDHEALALEFREILELAPAIELEITGFELSEINQIIDCRNADQEDQPPPVETASAPVTRPGDLWILGEHRLLCADARLAESYVCVLGDEKAVMMFTDTADCINNYRSRLMAAGSNDSTVTADEVAQFESILMTSLGHAGRSSVDGALHYVCTHWHHLDAMQAAGRAIYSRLQNICVLIKYGDTMSSSLYRSRHELVFVFQVGTSALIHDLARGRRGEKRPDVWDYDVPRVSDTALKAKPAPRPKPVAMIADAICDCSRCGDVVIDPFGGAGTTLIAAERTGRRARVIEIEPRLVDVSVMRWQRLTGGVARHADGGQPFATSSRS